jgi:hypothetical protein
MSKLRDFVPLWQKKLVGMDSRLKLFFLLLFVKTPHQ